MENEQNSHSFKLEELYKEVGINYRFFLSWRHALFAGYLLVVSALSLAFSWLYKEQHSLLWVTFIFGIIITLVFWALEFRNRELYHACQNTGEELEKNFTSVEGIFTILNKLQVKKITHSLAIDMLFIVTILTMLIALIIFFCGRL